LWLAVPLVAAFLAVGAGLWIVENPSSTLYRVFVSASELTVPREENQTDEFLVFLPEDSEANRAALYRATPNVSRVADSLLPRVIVVNIPSQQEATVAAMRAHEFVSLVMRYNPAFGCH
jgi:hypothetical protein